MAIVGSTAKPTTSQEFFGLNSTNQIAIALTLPAGGPWRVYRLGAWFAGSGMTAEARLCLWDSAGTLVRSAPPFTAANLAFGLGNSIQYEQDITAFVAAGGATIIVGFHRHSDHSVQHGLTGSGSHYHDTAGDVPETLSGWSTHAGQSGAYAYYELANTAPTVTPLSPANGLGTGDNQPDFVWEHADAEGNSADMYQFQISPASDFSYNVNDTGQNFIFPSPVTPGTDISLIDWITLQRSVWWYWRARVRDTGGLWSDWTTTRSLYVYGIPTASITSPTLNTAAPMVYTAGSNSTPRLQVGWSFSCPDGHTQTSAVIRVKDSGGTLLHTHNHTGSATVATITGFTPTNGTKYRYTVQATCFVGMVSAESAMNANSQARWGRASYRMDLGSTPLTLSSAVASVANGGQVIMEYGSTSGTTPEPTTWYASIAEVVKQRYVWHRVTLIPQAVASPTSPTLDSITVTYSNNVLVPDQWTLAAQAIMDLGTYVYGTMSLKHVCNGASGVTKQSIAVTANTDMILSGRVKTQGNPVAKLQVYNAAETVLLAEVAVPADTDWTRYETPVFNTGAQTAVFVRLVTSGATSTAAWFDALKLEASKVVTPWTPGFLGDAVVLDAGGLNINAQSGGVFRLQGSNGGTNDVVRLGKYGLRHGSNEFGAGTAFPTGPVSGDLFYRTDLGELCQYDGTRWLGEMIVSQIAEVANSTTNSNSGYALTLTRDIKIVRWKLSALTLTTNDGSNFWSVRLRHTDRGGAITGSTHGSQSLSGNGTTTYGQHEVTNSDVVSTSTTLGLLFDHIKTGSPGALYYFGHIMYRRIYT